MAEHEISLGNKNVTKFKPKNAYDFVQNFTVYYKTKTPTSFGPYYPIIREHIICTIA